ncbi:MAG: hypothetical protein FWE69_08485 [Clostridiales bacterium]|nr:hypothetical protein [Clostridiales bacterium]
MKRIIFFILAIGSVARISLAERGETYLSGFRFYALGMIDELHEKEQFRIGSHWEIEISGLDVLMKDPDLRWTDDTGVETAAPEKITLNLFTGFRWGIFVSPDDTWRGRPVVFVASVRENVFRNSLPPLPLSPDGEVFFVFPSADDPDLQAVKKAGKIVNMTNMAERLEKLAAAVEAPEEPMFIRYFCVHQISKTGLESAAKARLAGWRDDAAFNPELRLCADEALARCSPPEYQWSEGRLAFLRGLHELETVPEFFKKTAEMTLSRIGQRKAEYEKWRANSEN